jgi:DNA-binding transcriptional ArsR family regulator
MLPPKSQSILNLFSESKLLILKVLFSCTDPLCGCDLVVRLTMPKSLLSYHIRSLREAGYVEETRCGQKKQYRITPAQHQKVEQILSLIELI